MSRKSTVVNRSATLDTHLPLRSRREVPDRRACLECHCVTFVDSDDCVMLLPLRHPPPVNSRTREREKNMFVLKNSEISVSFAKEKNKTHERRRFYIRLQDACDAI